MWHIANNKIHTNAADKTLKPSESKSVKIHKKITDFTEISLFQGRRPILLKMSRPWNRELGWSLEIMQGTMPGARRRGRPRTAWMDNIKTWTGLPWKSQSECQRTEINGESTSMVWPTLGSRTAKEQNRTEQNLPDKHGVSMMKSVMSSFWRRGNDVTAADADWCTRIYSWLYGHAVQRWLSEHWQPAAMPSLSAACYRHVPDSVFKPHPTCARCRL